MIRWEGRTWGRNTQQSAVSAVLIGQISVLTRQISSQTAVIKVQQITAAIHGRMKIGRGVTGAAASGTSVCWIAVVSSALFPLFDWPCLQELHPP